MFNTDTVLTWVVIWQQLHRNKPSQVECYHDYISCWEWILFSASCWESQMELCIPTMPVQLSLPDT